MNTWKREIKSPDDKIALCDFRIAIFRASYDTPLNWNLSRI